jgi:hypothetical protein
MLLLLEFSSGCNNSRRVLRCIRICRPNGAVIPLKDLDLVDNLEIGNEFLLVLHVC